MRSTHRLTIMLVSTIATLAPAFAQAPSTSPWDVILRAHHVPWLDSTPASIQMTGVATRGSATEPLKITATGQEQLLTELGGKKEVSTANRAFKDDGDKVNRQNTPPGFTQLDVTGVFFVAQLRSRTVEFDPPVLTTFRNVRAWRVHAKTARAEVHYRQLPVRDEFDVYVDDAGILTGIARTFYKESPMFTFTMELAFGDYRNTKGTLLPYRIERAINGHNVERILVDAYQFDVPTNAAMFEARRTVR